MTQKRAPHLSAVELEQVRRALKNRREKERRKEINEQIDIIATSLQMNPSTDKVEILKRAAQQICIFHSLLHCPVKNKDDISTVKPNR